MNENSMIHAGKSTRSWARFRRVLACVILGGVLFWLGNCMICSYHVRVIQKSGGNVYFHWGTDRSGFPRKPWVPLPVRQVVGDVVFARPDSVSFRNCRVTVAALRSISCLEGVRSVSMDAVELEHGTLSELGSVRQLELLWLNNVQASKDELLQLKLSQRLEWLSLSQIAECDDDVLANLRSAARLRILNLAYIPVTSDGLRRFGLDEKKYLESVSFESVPVDGRVLEMLDNLPSLKSVSITRTKMSDDEIKAFFQRHPKIRGAPGSPGDIILKMN